MPAPKTPTVWIVDDDEDDQQFIGSAFLDAEPPIRILSLYDASNF
ncbi:hypothetical protein [Spirosoma endbachense]|nr:hypothetical protein [Spirosoma endbachense]